MVQICFYFQVHQPFRMKRFNIFSIGQDAGYFDDKKNKEILKKVANKCYFPTNKLLLELIKQHQGKFKIAFSITGVFLEQAKLYEPKLIESFKELSDTGCVEFLAETYYHSLSYLYSKEEFKAQVNKHAKLIKELFNHSPRVFRNTELIYNNELAKFVENLGYQGIIAEGADHILGWRSPNFVYSPKTASKIKLLLKNYKLSDDIAFRFSNKGWEEWPLTASKFAEWVNKVNGNGELINLFMDYETFGEHQWDDTGIFEFLKKLPEELFKHPDNGFITPSEAIKKYSSVAELDIHTMISWADLERDLSAWLGNDMQRSAIKELYSFESLIKKSDDEKLIEDWRKLQTSDHFYYMCTKWFSDGDVHKYFNPYDSPYDAFIAYMNILNDIAARLKTKDLKKSDVLNTISEHPSKIAH